MIAPQSSHREPVAIRAHPLVFAVVLFLASELMFFAGFFAAYYDLRTTNAVWPPPGVVLDTGPATFGTLLLALSSATVYLAARQFGKGTARVRAWLLATAVLGILFEVVAVRGWMAANFSIASNAYGSLYFAMTGFHALHVLAGIVLLIGLTIGLRRPAFNADHRAGAEAIMFYWHFVFVVWVGLWATIYFVK